MIPPRARVARPTSDFEVQLDRQLGFLRRSCDAFDAGVYDEAVRIALSVRVLVYNKKRDPSLLVNLGIQDKIKFVDTGIYPQVFTAEMQALIEENNPGSVLGVPNPTHVGLVELGDAGNGRAGWFAPLCLRRFLPGSPPDKATRGVANFEDWWNDPLVETSSGERFSRRDLVLIMANQDGAAHVDANLDEAYSKLIIDPLIQVEHGATDTIRAKMQDGNINPALHNVAFASVRQIAFEVMWSIERYKLLLNNPALDNPADPLAGLPIPPPPHRRIPFEAPLLIWEVEE